MVAEKSLTLVCREIGEAWALRNDGCTRMAELQSGARVLRPKLREAVRSALRAAMEDMFFLYTGRCR